MRLCNRMWLKINFLKWSKVGFNSEFSFYTDSRTKAKEPSLPNYLPIAGYGKQMDSCLSKETQPKGLKYGVPGEKQSTNNGLLTKFMNHYTT